MKKYIWRSLLVMLNTMSHNEYVVYRSFYIDSSKYIELSLIVFQLTFSNKDSSKVSLITPSSSIMTGKNLAFDLC